MRYDDIINLLNTIVNALIDPTATTNNLNKNNNIKFSNNSNLNNRMNPSNNSINNENITTIEKDKESVQSDDNTKFFDDNKNDSYYNKQRNTSSNPQGVIDSIAQELTSARLQQAIILSEIVGKPRSKVRNKRRF